MHKHRDAFVEAAVQAAGSQHKLAALLREATQNESIRQGHIWGWLYRHKPLPAHMAVYIEEVTTRLGQPVPHDKLCEDFPWQLVDRQRRRRATAG